MSNEFLSQDEVDALLENVVDDADAASESDGGAAGVRPYRLGSEERAVRGRLPGLDAVNDRFARLLRASLFDFIRRSPEIVAAPVRIAKYGEFVRTLVVPANLNVVTMKPLRGHALLVLEPALVFLVTDTLFGGGGRLPARAESREFSHTEQRIIQRLLGLVFDGYARAWQDTHPVVLENVRTESLPQFATIAAPAEQVVVSTFNVDLGGSGGALHVCAPYDAFEPVRERLDGPVPGERRLPDGRWNRMLQRRLQDASVEVVAALAATELRVADLVRLKAGDVLPIDLAPRIVACVDGVPLAECGYGESNGRYALRIERVLRPQADTPQGDPHA